MDASLLENSNIDTQIDDVVTEEKITAAAPLPLAALHQEISDSTDMLFFICYRGASALR